MIFGLIALYKYVECLIHPCNYLFNKNLNIITI